MARKRGHHRLKPEVSPITYIILGAIFIILTLAIIFSVDTKNQKFAKRYELENHNYNVTSLKKVEKNIIKGKNELVIFYVEQTEENADATLLLKQTQLMYNREEVYKDVKSKEGDVEVNFSEKVEKISFVAITLKDSSKFSDFLEEYEIQYTGALMMIYFEQGELVSEANISKQLNDPLVPGADKELKTMQENLKEFLRVTNKKLIELSEEKIINKK